MIIDKYIFLLGSLFLCALSWIICDLVYEPYIDYWNSVYPYASDNFLHYNPYITSWHQLRWKLFATERSLITLFVYLILPESKWRRVAWTYFFLAIANFVDRVFFNAQTLGINDLLVYSYLIYYTYKTLKLHLCWRG